jgi:hypothetical protein
MPYIDRDARKKLDGSIDQLAEAINGLLKQDEKYDYDAAFAGVLNYACTSLALKVIPPRRYWVIATVSGVFKNIGDEFYRRYAVPYEEEQREKNGDVYNEQ